MTTINDLPAHILLVHAIVVLLPLSAILLVLTAAWPGARRRLAGANAILSVVVLILVPITTDAGEWLERRVDSTELVRTHTELGDTAIFVALPVTVLALLIWWRHREQVAAESRTLVTVGSGTVPAPASRPIRMPQRSWLRPAHQAVTVVLIVLSVLAAGAAIYDIYRIGDSGAKATWQDQFSTTPSGR